jgi:hypothetical protein
MEKPSLEIGNSNWAIKEGDLLGYNRAGNDYLPIPITMTRASLGTRVNPEGLVEDVALLGSELITDGDFPTGTTAWSMTNNTGTNTRIENNHLIIETDGAYTQAEQLNVTVGGNQYKLVYTVLNSDGGDLALVTEGNTPSSIPNSVGTHIYYFTSHSTSFILKRRSGALNITITNVSVKEATIDNLPRVDYTDGTSSLLVEPQRTNIVPYSEDFTANEWSKTGAVVTPNQAISPDGTLNADLVELGTVNDRFADVISSPSGGTYTFTFYIKAKEGQSGNWTSYCIGDTSSSTVTFIDDSAWVRVSKTFIKTGAGNLIVYPAYRLNSNTIFDAYIWGAQLEEGSYATSYIKTSGGTVTRVQDQYSKTGINTCL